MPTGALAPVFFCPHTVLENHHNGDIMKHSQRREDCPQRILPQSGTNISESAENANENDSYAVGANPQKTHDRDHAADRDTMPIGMQLALARTHTHAHARTHTRAHTPVPTHTVPYAKTTREIEQLLYHLDIALDATDRAAHLCTTDTEHDSIAAASAALSALKYSTLGIRPRN